MKLCTSANATCACSGVGSIAIDGPSLSIDRPEPLLHSDRGDRVDGRHVVERLGIAPAHLFALGDAFLQPERRAIPRSRGEREVRELVRERVQPGVAFGRGARRDHRHASPLRDRDSPGRPRSFLGQARHRRERELIAHEDDVHRLRQRDADSFASTSRAFDATSTRSGTSARSASSWRRTSTPRSLSMTTTVAAVARAQPRAISPSSAPSVVAARSGRARIFTAPSQSCVYPVTKIGV